MGQRASGWGGKRGVKRTHLIDLFVSTAACKAVYAGSIPTPASIRLYETPRLAAFLSFLHSAQPSEAVLVRSPESAYCGGK